MKKSLKFRIIRGICLALYIIIGGILIIEACQNGTSSSSHSSNVGGFFANVVNTLRGDQAKKIVPTDCEVLIDNTNLSTGDTIDLKIKTIPEDSSFKSYRYEALTKNATVSNNGRVSFLSKGIAKIKVTNSDYNNITDIVEFNISDVKLEKLDLHLASAPGIPEPMYDETTNTYTIFKDKSYAIGLDIKPKNTTNVDISFNSSNNDYLEITADGLIKPKALASGLKINVIDSISNKTDSININIISPLDLSINRLIPKDIEIYIGEEIAYDSIDVEYINRGLLNNNSEVFITKDNNFKLEIDSNKVELNNKTIKGLIEGKVVAKVSNGTLSSSFNIKIKKAPDLIDFNITNIASLVINNELTPNLELIPNKYSKIDSYNIKSSDNNIVEIIDNKIIARGLGKATITFTINNIEKNYDINVLANTSIMDNEGNTKLLNRYEIIPYERLYFKTNTNIDLNNLFSYRLYDSSNNLISSEISFNYYLNNELIPNIINIKEPGKIDIQVGLDNYTKIPLSLYFIEDFNIDTSLTLDVSRNKEILLNGGINANQYLKVESDNRLASYSINDNKLKIGGISSGLTTFTIYPYNSSFSENINNEIKALFKKELRVSLNDILLTDIMLDVLTLSFDGIQNKIDSDNINIYLNDKLGFIPKDSEGNATFTEFIYSTENEDILSIRANGLIIPKKPGRASVVVKDLVSRVSKSFIVNVSHRVSINEELPIKISGNKAQYDSVTNTYTIQNGMSSTARLNFNPGTTNTSAKYTSLNEDILTIGSDGNISPHKKGNAQIKIEIENSKGEIEAYLVNINVTRKDAIQDLDEFFYKIRKGIGHFGAFLVFGIFSTLTYLLYFNHKWWIYSMPFNLLQGFSMAGLTEYLQTLTDNRYGCWSDVWLDYRGFLISSITIPIIFIILLIVSKHKKTKD